MEWATVKEPLFYFFVLLFFVMHWMTLRRLDNVEHNLMTIDNFLAQERRR